MRPRSSGAAIASALLATCGVAQAAPLDALLSAVAAPHPAGLGAASVAGDGTLAPRVHLELASDIANDGVDLLNLRGDTPYAGTSIGDYHGHHVRLGTQWREWQGDLAWWQRELQDRGDTHPLRSWQASLQYRLSGDTAPARRTTWAVRASAWGNQATRLTRRTAGSLEVEGLSAQLTDLQLRQPRDRQWQLDLIGSREALGLLWSGFGGLGTSRVRNDGVAARSMVAGCSYHLAFGREQLVATPDASCQDALIFVIPNRVLPYDAQAETSYRARYAHLGGSTRLDWQDWTLALGYEFQRWRREGIDALIASRGGKVYTTNHILVGEIGWSPLRGVQLLLRGQVMQHQWLGELPMAYNSLTASRFGHRYGLVSSALKVAF